MVTITLRVNFHCLLPNTASHTSFSKEAQHVASPATLPYRPNNDLLERLPPLVKMKRVPVHRRRDPDIQSCGGILAVYAITVKHISYVKIAQKYMFSKGKENHGHPSRRNQTVENALSFHTFTTITHCSKLLYWASNVCATQRQEIKQGDASSMARLQHTSPWRCRRALPFPHQHPFSERRCHGTNSHSHSSRQVRQLLNDVERSL
jgi:hypothetical protein